MKNTVKLLAILLVAVTVIATFTSCFEPQDKVFESNEMKITLTDEFKKQNENNMEVYASNDLVVMIIREDKSTFAEVNLDPNMTLKQYADIIAKGISTPPTIKEDNGLIYFEFINSVDNVDYKYFACVFVSEEAFWLVQFGTTVEKYSANREDIVKYAKTITIAE